MGEIGIDRIQFFYHLPFWEISAIISGYRKREQTFCNMTRWATYMIMSSSMSDLRKAGIHSVTDLLTFPWDKSEARPISEEEEEAIREELRRENQKNQSS